jgi:hypothetical protein
MLPEYDNELVVTICYLSTFSMHYGYACLVSVIKLHHVLFVSYGFQLFFFWKVLSKKFSSHKL